MFHQGEAPGILSLGDLGPPSCQRTSGDVKRLKVNVHEYKAHISGSLKVWGPNMARLMFRIADRLMAWGPH